MRKILAKELRIGNYHETYPASIPKMNWHSVTIDGKGFSAITAYGIHAMETGHKELEFTPIPVNETWLLALGFKFDGTDYTRFGMVDDRAFDIAVMLIDGVAVFSYTDSDKLTGLFTRKFEFVHELQNLYFALAKGELVVEAEYIQKSGRVNRTADPSSPMF